MPVPVMLRAVVVAGALGLAACVSTQPEPPVTAAPAGPAPVTGWLAGPAGHALDETDRQRAFEAQLTAVDTGRRSSWRSAKGHFGLVEPGAEAGGGCRSFTHTIYIDGRAQRGGGTACRAAGGWRVTA